MASAKLKPPKAGDEEEAAMIVTLGEEKISKSKHAPRAKIDGIGILSYATFAWVFEYLWAAYKGRVNAEQAMPCSIFDSANVNTTRLEHLWNAELKRRPTNPSFFRVVFLFIWQRLALACVIFFLCLIFGFIGPTCLVHGLVSYTEKPPRLDDGQIDRIRGLYLIGGILTVEICRVLMYGGTWAISYRTAIRARAAVLSLLYKSLLNSKSLRSKNPAEIVNICANDGQRVFDAVTFAPLVLMGPLVIVGGVIYLLSVIGPWSLLGLLVFVIFDVLQVFLGITLVRCRRLAIKNTEQRLYIMGEILKNIRLIKMNCWEDLFMKKIKDVRRDEKLYLRRAGYAQSIAIASGTIVPVVATLVTVLAVVYSGHDLLASDAFSAITVYFVMLFGIRMIPYGARYLGEAFVALKKIQRLLLYTKFEPNLSVDTQANSAVLLKNASFSWDKDEDASNKEPSEEHTALNTNMNTCLNDLNLVVEKREKIAICGPVGSGKTALLNSILGSTILDKGTISVSGTVSYADQNPCILGGTVRDNILFGQPMNSQRFDKVVSAAQLEHDFQNMPSNEMTEVGESGTALSGGQRARIQLARLLYSNRDICLVDDVLSSVNKEVADKIFQKGIMEFLANKTVFMVSSNPEYLADFDRVVFMDGGSIAAVGKHDELMKSDNPTYRMFFETHQRAVEPSDDYEVKPQLNGHAKNGAAKTETPAVESYITPEEDLGLKNISKDVYIEYIQAAGGYIVFSLVLLLFIANVGSGIFSTVWLSTWMKDVHGLNESSSASNTGARSLAENPDLNFYAIIYVVTIVVLFVSGLLKATAFVKLSIRASTNLHNRMLKSILHGTVSFHDSTPTGRILNRFSKDLDEIDVKLPFSSEALLQYMITCLGFLLTITFVFPLFLFVFFPLSAIFILFFLCFRAGIRSLKRTENVSRSPLFDHITSSLDGLATIHAFGQSHRFFETFKARLDDNSSAMFMFNAAMRWQAVWLDLLVVAISFAVSCFIVLLTGTIAPSDAGMALAFALQMSGVFQFAVRSQTELESKLTAVERVSHYYKNVEQEPYISQHEFNDAGWPTRGDIKFEDVVLRYRKNAPAALNHVDFEVSDGEKIGIFGRTGSGKTSITNALYRLYPVESGRICIDRIDISQIDLQRLRRSMSIIPQGGGIFTGTLRFNLDPENHHTDDRLWECLDRVGLKSRVASSDEKLELKIESDGKNLSAGQAQLIILARTLLRNTRIVILDEATSSLDAKSDEQIQSMVREAFRDSTVLLISHRMENIAGFKTLEVVDGKIYTSADSTAGTMEQPS